MVVIKNLILPLAVVLVLYAIPVVPTWRVLKRKKASYGAFLGWIAGEILAINIIFYFLSFAKNYYAQYFFELAVIAIFVSAFFLFFLPLVIRALLFKKESLKKANLYVIAMFLIVVLEVLLLMYALIRGFAQFSF